jgi:glucose-6-phosphate 1-dehydrogenase
MKDVNLVVMGITSDLAKKKLIPALFQLWNQKINLKIIGVYNRARSSEELFDLIKESVGKKEGLEKFFSCFYFESGDLKSEEIYRSISKKLDEKYLTIFYLATFPEYYQSILEGIKQNINLPSDQLRLVIEKPFGSDKNSAKYLNNLLKKYFSEKQIFRIDHYLGKETILNILSFRRNNLVINKLLSSENVDHIQIIASETKGVEDRLDFYDKVGALRDVGQNHLLQLLALVTMETSKDYKDEKMKVFKNLRVFKDSLVLGQYENFEKNDSKTETYFAFKTSLKNGKLKNVPIYVRAGKKLKKEVVEVTVVFKENIDKSHNQLVFRIQPNEGIVLRVVAKKPGLKMECQNIDLQFCYQQSFEKIVDPYVKLLTEVIEGNQFYFNQGEESEWQWDFIDRLKKSSKNIIEIYEVGSSGPKAADDLLEKDGRKWIEPEDSFCKI